MGLYLKLTFVGLFACASLFANSKRINYIDAYKHIAIQEMERTGIPASIKLAQALLESGSGSSYLAQEANNHFGIKCGSRWDGEVIYRKDDDYDDQGNLKKSCFRKYDSAKHSFEAHSAFLQNNKRYSDLFDLKLSDYKGWAKGLRKAGYATNPTYSKLLISIIERYELYKYDAMTSDELLDFEMDLATTTPSVEQQTKPAPSPAPKKETIADIVPTIERINQVKMTQATGKESVAQIARRTNTPVKAILRFNEGLRLAGAKLAAGERVYLQPKRNLFRGRKYSHTVAEGESMYDIAQLYAIRLDKLYDRNLMTAPAQPAVGQIVLLSGRRDRTPNLRQADKQQQSIVHIPTSLLVEEKDNEEEYIDWEEASTSVEHSTPMVRPTDTKPIVVAPTHPEPMAKPVVPAPCYTSAPKPTLSAAKQHSGDVVHMEYYKVSVGDSLYAIARRYKLSLEQLIAWNELRDNTIQVGQLLRVE